MSTIRLRAGGCRPILVLFLLGLAVPAQAQEERGAAGSSMTAFDTMVLSNNQSLSAFDVRVQEQEAQARREEQALPQPMLEYMLDLGAPWAGHFTVGHSLRVMQSIPRGGARTAQAEPFRAEGALLEAARQEAATALLRDLRLDLVELARIEARIGLYREEIEILDDALSVVEALIPVGRAAHSDLLQVELARESALDEVASLQAARKSRQKQLAARLGATAEELGELGIPKGLLTDWFIELPEREVLLGWVREADPAQARFEAALQVTETRTAAVDQRLRPWPTLMLGYSNQPPMWEADGPRAQMIEVGVSFALPVFRDQYQAETARFGFAAAAIEEERAQYSRESTARLEALLEQWEADRARLRRHQRELLPLASDLARQTLIGVELGERTASDFLLATRQEIDVERRIIELQAQLLRQLMEMQQLSGGRLGASAPWAYSELGGER